MVIPLTARATIGERCVVGEGIAGKRADEGREGREGREGERVWKATLI
jgi:hypothetical protein